MVPPSDPIALLEGAIVQRVDRLATPKGEAALIRVRIPGAGQTLHVLVSPGPSGGIGLVADAQGLRGTLRDRGGGEALWRARLEQGRILGVGERTLAVSRHEGSYALRAPLGTSLELVNADEAPFERWTSEQRAALEAKGEALAAWLTRTALEEGRRALVRALQRALARIQRRIDAVRGDLARIGEAEALAARAQLFVAEAARAPRGARSLKAIDWSSGEPVPVEFPLDPARPAREQIDAVFKRARRLKEGARIGRQRLEEAESLHRAIAAIEAQAAEATSLAELEELGRRARTLAPRDVALVPTAGTGAGGDGGKRPRDAQARPPFRTFLATDGGRLLVGRGAAHNDALTFRVARPHDLWLHAKGRTGAHVLVPLEKNATCPPERLVEAAHLAAHFSDAKDEALTEIQYTPRRYLRKPRGSPPGFVVVDREKVMVLRRDQAVLRRLLEREEVA